MKQLDIFVRTMIIAFLLLLVTLPAMSWAEAPDKMAINHAIHVPSKGKWIIMGTAVPGDTITVFLYGREIGKSTVIANGRWAVVVNRSAVVANSGDLVTAASRGGGTASQVVDIR